MKKSKSRPASISVGGDLYRVAVLHIHSRDEQGRPKDVSFLHDDQSINIRGGEEFMTAFVPAHMVRKGN